MGRTLYAFPVGALVFAAIACTDSAPALTASRSPVPHGATSPPPALTQAAIAFTASQLVTQIPDCRSGRCEVRTDFTTGRGGKPLRFAVVRVPGAQLRGEETFRMALFNVARQQLTWLSEVVVGAPHKRGYPIAVQSQLGHIVVAFSVGADASMLTVFDPGDGVDVTFFGPAGEGMTPGDMPGWWTNMPTALAADLDGDGVFELVLGANDCLPNCADGTITVRRHAWRDSEYVLTGCTVLGVNGEDRHFPAAMCR